MEQPIIEVKDLLKNYGKVRAVDGVSFTVRQGSCFGILGPNGAGKTTTIEIMESIQTADAGEVLYRGQKIDKSFKQKIGIQFQNTSLQEFLTVRETLELFSRLYPKKRPLDEIIKICSLEDFINRDNRKLSGGQRQRMLLGIALISDPELLFLDEPTTGLDPHARRNFWGLIENIRKENKTVILTTHYMDEAEYLCNEIVIMNHGKIIEQGHPKALLRKHFGDAVIRIPEGLVTDTVNTTCKVSSRNGYAEIECKDMTGTIRELLDRGVSLNDMTVERRNLDDLFLRLTGSTLNLDGGGPA